MKVTAMYLPVSDDLSAQLSLPWPYRGRTDYQWTSGPRYGSPNPCREIPLGDSPGTFSVLSTDEDVKLSMTPETDRQIIKTVKCQLDRDVHHVRLVSQFEKNGRKDPRVIWDFKRFLTNGGQWSAWDYGVQVWSPNDEHKWPFVENKMSMTRRLIKKVDAHLEYLIEIGDSLLNYTFDPVRLTLSASAGE